MLELNHVSKRGHSCVCMWCLCARLGDGMGVTWGRGWGWGGLGWSGVTKQHRDDQSEIHVAAEYDFETRHGTCSTLVEVRTWWLMPPIHYLMKFLRIFNRVPWNFVYILLKLRIWTWMALCSMEYIPLCLYRDGYHIHIETTKIISIYSHSKTSNTRVKWMQCKPKKSVNRMYHINWYKWVIRLLIAVSTNIDIHLGLGQYLELGYCGKPSYFCPYTFKISRC